jgi:hypothetical protein
MSEFEYKKTDFLVQNSDANFEDEFEEEKTKLNWKGSIYDDDEFELDKEWQSHSLFEDIPEVHTRHRVAQLPSQKTEEKPETTEAPVEEVKLNLPKGGWKVQVVSISETQEFPSLKTPVTTTATKPTFKTNTKLSKWKKVDNFFEDDLQVHSPPQYAPPPTPAHTHKKSPPQKFTPQPHQKLLQPQTPIDTKVVFKNTRMCTFAKQGCKRSGCSFAHSLEEFQPPKCRFEATCKNKPACKFKHSEETKEAFLARLALVQ